MDLTQYYLDFDKVNSLKDKDFAGKIHDYYRDMIYCNEDGRKSIATSLFNTLNNNGFLKSIRDEKIGLILDGNNSINT
jgi:hypothetical protein